MLVIFSCVSLAMENYIFDNEFFQFTKFVYGFRDPNDVNYVTRQWKIAILTMNFNDLLDINIVDGLRDPLTCCHSLRY